MEITPNADGISIIETDLEVDFAPPKGYVEPTPQPRPPPPTMASKLNIDSTKVDSIPLHGHRRRLIGRDKCSRRVGVATPSGPFRGSGMTLSGKKSKGKKERQIEQLDPFSMVRRTDMPRIITSDTQLTEKKIPAALNLPFGKLFFGYEVIPVGGKPNEKGEDKPTETFGGSGTTLSGRAPRPKAQESGQPKQEAPTAFTLGGGRVLGESSRSSRYATPSSSDGRNTNDSKREVIDIDSD